MSFDFSIAREDGTSQPMELGNGDVLFILGANGAGKSSLMQSIYTSNFADAHRILAHRQNWFTENRPQLSAHQKVSTESNIRSDDQSPDSRWRDNYSRQRADVAIYNLINSYNLEGRRVLEAMKGGDFESAEKLAHAESPLETINRVLSSSHIPLQISVGDDDSIVACKNGGAPYSIAQLSDGERNAVLLAADILTVKPNTLLVIDEPERHLHRSIVSPLLSSLFSQRADCAFVVSTHEIMLPVDNPQAQTLLLRSCQYPGPVWSFDLWPRDGEIDQEIKREILGAREGIVFVEGERGSLDFPLYSLLFPEVTVVPHSTCKDVEHSVRSIRGTASLHWLDAYGIVDNDGISEERISEYMAEGVFPLKVHSVESIYYDDLIVEGLAKRHAEVVSGDPSVMVEKAKTAASEAIKGHAKRMCSRRVSVQIRDEVLRLLPDSRDVEKQVPIQISIDVPAKLAEEQQIVDEALQGEDLQTLFARYPIRETGALDAIAKALGFVGSKQYADAVIKMLQTDPKKVASLRAHFDPLVRALDKDRAKEKS